MDTARVERPRRRKVKRMAGRTLFMLVAFASLYLLWPSLTEVFTSWRSLFEMHPGWFAGAILVEAASFVAIWQLQRIALQTKSWYAVGTSQLAGNALGRVIPGGMAASGTLQYQMLIRAGLPSGRIASALASVSVLLFGTVLALPLLSLPAIIGGTPVARGLAQAAYLGAGLFVLVLIGGVLVFVWDRPLKVVARATTWVLNQTLRRRNHVDGLADRLLHERDSLRIGFGERWKSAVVAAGGRWILDYLALVACLWAVGAEPNPSLVLLAFVAAAFLGMIPLTPGGLGFVEAGLTGLLALAGVSAGAAVVATLAYRLVSFWLPIPAGGVAYLMFRHRFP
ncbi:MAG TPA: lysylphosphatidylglycerol synthase transmembrane domain-containing protein [Gaiellaceae bacterium]|nr:lysylphosphatidylglycerol synthase transmembrane domain-containing protein [Gaiellaceae bacterium]